jgi:hypothetical protein
LQRHNFFGIKTSMTYTYLYPGLGLQLDLHLR